MSLNNRVLSRFRRSRTIFLCLIIVCVIYIIFNQLFLNSITVSDTSRHPEDKSLELNQINVLNNRLHKLSNSIEKSHQDVSKLNVLINQAQLKIAETPRPSSALPNPNDIPNIAHHNKIAVLVFSCNRPDAIRNHIDQLLAIRQVSVEAEKFPIIVSQDCGHKETEEAILNYRSKLYGFIKQPDLTDILFDKSSPMKKTIPKHMRGYFKIARHYKWALDEIFMKHKFETVIMNEDDLNISPDFFSYFEAMNKILVSDPSLFCVSAWNDNGKSTAINSKNLETVYRTDFFPGLGWMMQRSLWLELREKWPYGFWDDWIRNPDQRKSRSCLRPEISRTEMSNKEAKKGVSQGQFLEKFLKLIPMNHQPVDWASINNEHLLKKNYDPKFYEDVYSNAHEMPFIQYLKKNSTTKFSKILLTYENKADFVKYANYFGIMNDFKAGVPRTAYKGVVQVYFQDETIYIGPAQKKLWSGYPEGW